MAKKIYFGVGGKARKVKKVYVGVGGKARKVKKAYIGVGGKARLFWSGGEISYYGVADPLDEACVIGGATSVGNYALFVGRAYHLMSDSSKACAYSTSLTRQSIENSYDSGIERGAARAGNYAIFAGSIANNQTDYIHSDITPYNSSLVRMQNLARTEAYCRLQGISIGNLAIFGGGKHKWNESSSTSYFGSSAFSISDSLVYTSSGSQIYGDAVAIAGTHAVYTGGQQSSSTYNKNFYTIDNSLTVNVLSAELSAEKDGLGGASAGNYAIFVGGEGSGYNTFQKTVDIITPSLTKINGTSLSVARSNMGSVSIGDFAMFAGGQTAARSVTNIVEIYDSSLTLTKGTSLTSSRANIASTVVGDYALFAGGEIIYSTNYDTVNVYTI